MGLHVFWRRRRVALFKRCESSESSAKEPKLVEQGKARRSLRKLMEKAMDCQHSKRSHYLTGTLTLLVFLFRTMQAFARPKCYEECTKFGHALVGIPLALSVGFAWRGEQEQPHQNSMDFGV